MTSTGRRWLLSAPLIGASITLFWLSSIPGLTVPDLGFGWQDKLVHAAAYAVYGIAVQLAVIGNRPSVSAFGLASWSLSVGLAFALTDEWHQSYVPHRVAGFDDVVADVVGLLFSCALISSVRSRFGVREQEARRPQQGGGRRRESGN